VPGLYALIDLAPPLRGILRSEDPRSVSLQASTFHSQQDSMFPLKLILRSLVVAIVGVLGLFLAPAALAQYVEGIESPVVNSEPVYYGEPPVGWEDVDTGKKYYIHGNNRVPLTDPSEDPHVPFLDCDDRDSFWYSGRANMIGQDVPDHWDFYNLINTDRPDFTDAPYTVGKGVTLLETGYTLRKATDPINQAAQTRRSLPEALIRYGVTDEFELRLKWNGYVISELSNFQTGTHEQIFGTDDLIAAFKYEVWQQEGARPLFTVLSGSTLPSGTNGVSSNQLQPFVNGVVGWGLRRWLYLKMSAGIDWQKTSISTLIGGGSEPFGPVVLQLRDNEKIYHASVSCLFQISQRVGGFVEYFSLMPTNGTDNHPADFVDTGLFYYITPHVQLDARIGERVDGRVDEFFTGAGFSTRW
jgi:hypothetical protein